MTSEEIEELPREVSYDTYEGAWRGRSEGIIQKEAYLEVYPAKSFIYGSYQYEECEPIRVPLNRIYKF